MHQIDRLSCLSGGWPALRLYDQDHLARVALLLGGIGTGTVSLGGRGDLRDWEIVNRPAKGFTPMGNPGSSPFFALYAQAAGGNSITRALEGPIELEKYEGPAGSRAANHGLPRFRHCMFAAAYPFGQVRLSDPDVPLDVCIQAFNPLVPADTDASGLPVAILRFLVTNKAAEEITAAICGSLPNFIGTDGSQGKCQGNRNVFRRSDRLSGLYLTSEGVPNSAEQWGTLALATTATEALITHRTAWAGLGWNGSLLDFWDDLSDDGELEERVNEGGNAPMASLAAKFRVPAGATYALTFLITWHFPNRQTWTPVKAAASEADHPASLDNRVGNHYTTRFGDAWEAAELVARDLPQLEARTLAFVSAFCASDLPEVVKEAALFNLTNLRSQTCFRTEDGRFFGWEGCHDKAGCCYGSCTHVWNYEQATAFLFGDLAMSMRDTEFARATDESGLMSFRVNLPLASAQTFGRAAADGQLGTIMRMYRDWQLSGDDDELRRLWPGVKQALRFCWIPGGWDADRDGVMEGCQHNTMDVEYYGPNPQMGTWYLGALRATEEMATYLGEEDFAATCRDLFQRGREWIDAQLFNGEYYEHEVRPLADASAAAPGLRVGMGGADVADPPFQLGKGCLVDQLAGQYMAHVCGLGYLLDTAKVRQTLESIMKYNFRAGFHAHFNNMRSYVLGDESGLLMATYPLGQRPRQPFPYFTEVMTGFEYTAAIHMLYEGQVENGLRCISAIRERYDGRKRNPFNEAECGHHYARAMASWAAVLALTGFLYSGVSHSMTMKACPGVQFWSSGYAWGTCEQVRALNGMNVELRVLGGTLRLKRFSLTGLGELTLDAKQELRQGCSMAMHIPFSGTNKIA